MIAVYKNRFVRRSGFTLIEILVVIAIIASLSALLIYGLRHAAASTKERATRVTMEDLRGMLAELDANSNGHGVADMESAIYGASSGAQVPAPGNVSTEGTDRLTHATVKQTQQVMQFLWNVAPIRQHINQLPKDVKMYLNPSTSGGDQAPVLLDAYGNPIIYVPSGGLTGVTTSGGTVVVTSPDGHGFFASAGSDDAFTGVGGANYKVPPGDDNLYSFRN